MFPASVHLSPTCICSIFNDFIGMKLMWIKIHEMLAMEERRALDLLGLKSD